MKDNRERERKKERKKRVGLIRDSLNVSSEFSDFYYSQYNTRENEVIMQTFL